LVTLPVLQVHLLETWGPWSPHGSDTLQAVFPWTRHGIRRIFRCCLLYSRLRASKIASDPNVIIALCKHQDKVSSFWKLSESLLSKPRWRRRVSAEFNSTVPSSNTSLITIAWWREYLTTTNSTLTVPPWHCHQCTVSFQRI
jgi:hypothetical protein